MAPLLHQLTFCPCQAIVVDVEAEVGGGGGEVADPHVFR